MVEVFFRMCQVIYIIWSTGEIVTFYIIHRCDTKPTMPSESYGSSASIAISCDVLGQVTKLLFSLVYEVYCCYSLFLIVQNYVTKSTRVIGAHYILTETIKCFRDIQGNPNCFAIQNIGSTAIVQAASLQAHEKLYNTHRISCRTS